MTRLTVVGDALLDRDLEGRAERLAPDAPVPVVDAIEARPRAGGAGLAATLAARSGFDVTLICALGRDLAGEELASLLAEAGVTVVDLGLDGATPEKVRVLAGGRPVVRLDHGGVARGCGPLPAGALDGADAVLVSDYGRGVAAEPSVRAALRVAPGRGPARVGPPPQGPRPDRGRDPRHPEPQGGDRRRRPRAGRLRHRLVAGAASPSPTAARGRCGPPPPRRRPPPPRRRPRRRRPPLAPAAATRRRPPPPSPVARTAASSPHASSPLAAGELAGRALAARWRAVAVCVTLGARGAVMVSGDGPALAVPAPRVTGDPCGAGDCFAATAAGRLAAGALPVRGRARRGRGRLGVRRRRRRRGARDARPARRRRSDRRAGPRRRRHRGRDRRLLRPPARRPRPHARAGACARRLPRRLPELRRVRAAAQGRRSPARRAGRSRRGACRRSAASTPSRSSRRTTRARSCARCARTCGPRAATTRWPSCRRPRRSPSGAGAR